MPPKSAGKPKIFGGIFFFNKKIKPQYTVWSGRYLPVTLLKTQKKRKGENENEKQSSVICVPNRLIFTITRDPEIIDDIHCYFIAPLVIHSTLWSLIFRFLHIFLFIYYCYQMTMQRPETRDQRPKNRWRRLERTVDGRVTDMFENPIPFL